MELQNTIISCISVAALLILDYMVLKTNLAGGRFRHLLHLAILVIILIIAAELATVRFEAAGAAGRSLQVLGNVAGFAASPLVPVLLGCAITEQPDRRYALLWVPAAANALLSVLSAFSPLVFWVDPAGRYTRGGLFWVYVAAYGCALLYLFIATLRLAVRYQNEDRPSMFLIFLFVLFGSTVQVAFPRIRVTWLCVSFAMVLYYTYYCELCHQVDSLTRLLNRYAYENHLRRVEGRRDAVVCYFDIDSFKTVNDRYGHAFGDRCLQDVAGCIRSVYGKTGLCFRIGGDEFCVVGKKTSSESMQALDTKFVRQLEALRAGEPRLPMVSVGWAQHRAGGSLQEAVAEADRQMYTFKQRRKDAADRPL